MTEPTRQMPNPSLRADGNWEGSIVFSPTGMNTRARFSLHIGPIVPVILVPGIMGTNLQATRIPRSREERNTALQPGQSAWRAPNGAIAAMKADRTWQRRNPAARQRVLDGPTLEIDTTGDIDFDQDEAKTFGLTRDDLRLRGWGEVHADSYGALLYSLETNLNRTFNFDTASGASKLRDHWKKVMAYDHTKWGVRNIEPLTMAELEKHAQHHYPVYAVGYNWLQSCSDGATRLQSRILEIIKYWQDRRLKCEQVILVTHSMGGLVARACAKRIPDKIAGVIHGVMPALGAPACYRRIACGTETSSPSFAPPSRLLDRIAASVFADIAGPTTEATTAVMATAPGPLQLLPNHRYPRPWLHIGVVETVNKKHESRWLLSLPSSEETRPYGFYRDLESWYRLINPAFADPAKRHQKKPNGVATAIWSAVNEAERFHVHELGDYYHPNTFGFYGADTEQLTFGQMRWLAKQPATNIRVHLTAANVKEAIFCNPEGTGARTVKIEQQLFTFEPQDQDASGDGTVPKQSGAGPAGKIRRLFETRGFSHQSAYKEEAMLALTHYLIVKIVQGMP